MLPAKVTRNHHKKEAPNVNLPLPYLRPEIGQLSYWSVSEGHTLFPVNKTATPPPQQFPIFHSREPIYYSTLPTQAAEVFDNGSLLAVVDGLPLVEQQHLIELREDVRSRLVDGAHHDHALLSQSVQEHGYAQRRARVFPNRRTFFVIKAAKINAGRGTWASGRKKGC